MTITARYPGRCSVCGRAIRAGEQIDWDKDTRSVRHPGCAAQHKAAAAVAEYTYRQGSGYGDRPEVGQVVRHRETKELYTVLAVSQKYVREDGMSFGVGEDSGYIYTVACRRATAEEQANVAAEQAVRKAERQRESAILYLLNQVQTKAHFEDFGSSPPEDATEIAVHGNLHLYRSAAALYVKDMFYDSGYPLWRAPLTTELEAAVAAIQTAPAV